MLTSGRQFVRGVKTTVFYKWNQLVMKVDQSSFPAFHRNSLDRQYDERGPLKAPQTGHALASPVWRIGYVHLLLFGLFLQHLFWVFYQIVGLHEHRHKYWYQSVEGVVIVRGWEFHQRERVHMDQTFRLLSVWNELRSHRWGHLSFYHSLIYRKKTH